MFIFQINNTDYYSQVINEFCEAVKGKGYDKLQQWRKGEIDRINYDEVSQSNWEIYLREEAEKTYNDWLKKNPTYFEDKNNNGSGCSLCMMELEALEALENENKQDCNMNQMEYYENRTLYAKKHSRDNVCANCKYCYESSSFPQYDSCKKCKIDGENISNQYQKSCPAFEFK